MYWIKNKAKLDALDLTSFGVKDKIGDTTMRNYTTLVAFHPTYKHHHIIYVTHTCQNSGE